MEDKRKKKSLTKEDLFEMFPYLRQELAYKSEREVGPGYACGTNELSVLGSAILIEGQKKGFSDPYMRIMVSDYSTNINETKVEFVNPEGKVVRSLRQRHYRTFPSSTGLSPDSSQGELTDKVLGSLERKPPFIVVKKIHTHERKYSKSHEYNIEVYRINKSTKGEMKDSRTSDNKIESYDVLPSVNKKSLKKLDRSESCL